MKRRALHRRYGRVSMRRFESQLGRKLTAIQKKLWRAVHAATSVEGWRRAKAKFDHAMFGGR